MKLLRDVPTTSGRPELAQLAEPAEQLEVVLDGLAEADPRIEPDPLLGDPGRHRDLDPLGEERLDVVDDVVVGRVLLHRPRVPGMCIRTTPALALGAQRRHLRVAAQRGDVVDDRGPGVERRLGDRGLRGVDRDRRPDAGQPATTGTTRAAPPRRDLRGPRPGRLPADVEDVRPVRRQLLAVRDRRLRIEEQPPVARTSRGSR